MSKEAQIKDVAGSVSEQLAVENRLADPATLEGLKSLVDKASPLLQAGRFDNVIDLLSLISDNVEFLDEAMLEKATKAGEEMLALGWTTGNAVRMANAQTEKLEKPPGLFHLMGAMNDPDVRRSLYFFIGFMRIIGRQMRPD